MGQLPQFVDSPEHLRRRPDLRMRLVLCAEELRIRYNCPIYLCGSGLEMEAPNDWDVRCILADEEYAKQERKHWSQEAADRTTEQQRLNLLKFDIRIYPARRWYRVGAIRMDQFEAEPVVVEEKPTQLDPEGVERNKKLIAEQKDNPEFHLLLGTVLMMKGDLDTAQQAFMRALELDSKNAGGWLNLGNLVYERGDFKRAAVYYKRALMLRPDYAKAYINMANTLTQLGMYVPALRFYDQAIDLEPDVSAAHHNKANCLNALQKYKMAGIELNRALEMDPQDYRYLNTLGNLRSAEEMKYAAAAAYRTAMRIEPKYAPLYTNLGNVFSDLGRPEESVRNYERGLVLDPRSPGVRYNLALGYLRRGNYRLGWKVYEGRWGFRELNSHPRAFKEPMWDGSPLDGKRILVHCEQGLGDTIQFSRYIPLVERMGGIVFFEVQQGLQRLMVSSFGAQVCTRGLPLPNVDVQCPLMSMPFVFKTDIDTVPCPIPYIRPWNWEVKQMLERYPRQDGVMRIGINWAGNPKYKKDRERSVSLNEFAALSGIDGVKFYSLQKGPAARQIEKYSDRVTVIDASSDAHDFAESAALVATLDLVITSDSSPMHLAAAMGKEVWLLLAYQPDWRWMDSGETTPWYPNVRLFRQDAPGDWAGVFSRVRRALEEKMNVIRIKNGHLDGVAVSGLSPAAAANTARVLNLTSTVGFSFTTEGGEYAAAGHSEPIGSDVPKGEAGRS